MLLKVSSDAGGGIGLAKESGWCKLKKVESQKSDKNVSTCACCAPCTLCTFLSDVPSVGHSRQTSKLVGLLFALSALINLRPLHPTRPPGSLLDLGCLSGALCGLCSLVAAIRRAAGLTARLAALVRAALGSGSEALRCGPLSRRRGCGGNISRAVRDPRQFGREHRR